MIPIFIFIDKEDIPNIDIFDISLKTWILAIIFGISLVAVPWLSCVLFASLAPRFIVTYIVLIAEAYIISFLI